MSRKLTALLLVLLSLCACGRSGDTSSVKVELEESQQFSQRELEAAVSCLEAYFRKNFYDCTMEQIRYVEEYSERAAESYLSSANGGVKHGITEGNVIVLDGDFRNGMNPPAGLSANCSDYAYHWLMIRDDADSPWRIDIEASGQG